MSTEIVVDEDLNWSQVAILADIHAHNESEQVPEQPGITALSHHL